MCNFDVTSRTVLPHSLSPQCNAMSSSSFKDGTIALTDLGTTFVATILHAKDFIEQLEGTFCNELWPAFCAELENSRCRMMALERDVNASRKLLEERQLLELEREHERALLRGENDVLRVEKEQLLKNLHQAQGEVVQHKLTSEETQRLIQENQNLQRKVQSLTEENLKGDKERQSLSEEVEQLWKSAKLSAAKEVFLEAENKKFDAMARSQLEKSERLQAKRNFALMNQQKTPKDADPPRFSMVGKDLPVTSNDQQDLKNRDQVQSVASLQGKGQAVDCSASDLVKERMRGRSQVSTEAAEAVNGAVLVIPGENHYENPLSRQPMRQVEAKLDAKEVYCERPKVNCDVECTPCPAAGVVDSDETTLGIVQEDLLSVGVCQEYPPEDPLENPRSGQPIPHAEATLDGKELGCYERPKANGDTAGFFDLDETTLGIAQEDPLFAGTFQDYPLISISSEPQGGRCDESFHLACEKGNRVTSHGAVEQKVEQNLKAEESKGVMHSRAPLVPILLNPRSCRPTSKISVTNKPSVTSKPVDIPKEQRWRQTRLRTEPSDRDPHDSFLDTPRERVLAQLAAQAASREEVGRQAESLAVAQGGPAPLINKLEGVNIVEAREGGEKAAAQRQDHPPFASSRPVIAAASNAGSRRPGKEDTKALSTKAPPFKFNEPVRKKREREGLLATDCKQCKKFYDAVVAEDGDGAERFRCDHHDAASRHRFKYLPPPTPEGFWNIGFDDSVNPPDEER